MRIKIAARQSDLARLQAYLVGQALTQAHPGLEIDYQFRASLGDLNQHDPLWKMPQRGVFTEDFLEDLKAGRCDLVVHSWKDLPTEERAQTEIAATLERADMRDVLLLRKDIVENLPARSHLKVLSSSPRRSYNLTGFLKEVIPGAPQTIEFLPVRGNVPTRIRKLIQAEGDALIVAKAALDRLLSAEQDEFQPTRNEISENLKKCRWMILPLAVNPGAAAQGALAIEIRRGDERIQKLLKHIHHVSTYECVQDERRILTGYGGGCHQKIGVSVFDRSYGRVILLKGLTEKGEVLDSVQLHRSRTWKKPASPEAIWPQQNERESRFFERRSLNVSAVQDTHLWVARANALPENWRLLPEQLVWSAGLETWKKLAQRGIWVNGSSESFGEDENPRHEVLARHSGFRELPWTKLTHAAGYAEPGKQMKNLATYELVSKVSGPDLKGKTHFYWSSGSSFLRALELFPEIVNGEHFCGPGNTYQMISKQVPRVHIFLSYEQWLKEVSV